MAGIILATNAMPSQDWGTMNFIFVSPQFPHTYWQFCDRLRKNGATVLGIGDTPYDDIDDRLKQCLAEYYWTPSLEDYDAVFRAVAFFSWKYGKIDWIESNNEYWLSQDARLRTDFNVTTGASFSEMRSLQSKADMKPLYAKGGVPSARQIKVDTPEAALAFIEGGQGVGWPVFVKPERGVGSGGAARLDNPDDLARFFEQKGDEPYVMEEFVTGDIVSYDAILDSHSNPLFENMEEFPPSMAEVVQKQLDVAYYSRPKVDPRLRKLGRAAAKSFGIRSRFVHMEFFRLTKDKPGLGSKGDYVGLEVNVRPPGGYTPDMMNYAHSTDVYQIWADMVTKDRRDLPESNENYYCVYASRRDVHSYVHTHEEILERFGGSIVMCERMPDALSDDMGNQMYTARFKTAREKDEFVRFVQKQA